MQNPKEIGNEYERHIFSVIRDMLGVFFKPTKRSGGADHKGDGREWRMLTPLSKYCIEIKKHLTQKSFNRELRSDLLQARTQNPANKNWMLITSLPNTDIDLVIMDLRDYLCNDILGQMTGNREDLKKNIIEIMDLIYELKKKFEKLKGRL